MSRQSKIIGTNERYAKSLYYLAKIFGLAPFALENNKLISKSSIEIYYPIGLTLFCIPYYVASVNDDLRNNDYSYTFLSRAIRGSVQILHALGTLLFPVIFAVRRKEIIETMNFLIESATAKDNFRSAEPNRSNGEKRLKITAYSAAVLLSMKLTSQIAIVIVKRDELYTRFLEDDFKLLTIHRTVYKLWTSYLNHVGVLIFLTTIISIEILFRRINERLSNISTSECESESEVVNDDETNVDRVNEPHERNIDLNIKSSDDITNVAIFRDELVNIIEKLLGLFSIEIILFILNNVIVITIIYYYTLIAVEGFDTPKNSVEFWQNFIYQFDVFIMLVELLSIGVVCDSIERTATSTGILVGKIWIKYRPIGLKDELQMLSLQLMQRPLKISALGFFSLNYSYLYKMFCAMIAYFVIMVQLDTSSQTTSDKFNHTTLNMTN